jgi:DHA3 family tetracycline resistance protein-like MFS transporter
VKKLNANLVYLILSGVSSMGFALVFTVNLVYQATTVGLNPLQLVLVGTTLEVTCFLGEIPTGVVADVYSRRLSVIIGFFLIGIGFVVEGAIPRFEGVLLAQVLWGIGATFTSGATEAWVADEVGDANAGRAYLRGSQAGQATWLLGTFVSVILGSVLINLPILVGGVTFVGLGLILLMVMPEDGFAPTPSEGRTSWQKISGTFRSGLRLVQGRPALTIILGVSLFFGLYSEGYDRLWTDHVLTNFAFPAIGQLQPVVWFGIMNAAAMFLGIAVTEFARRRLDMNAHRAVARALLIVNALLSVCLIGFGLAGSFAFAFAIWSAISALRTVTGPVYTAWINQHVESSVRATVISMTSQVNAFGQIVGGPVIGALATALAVSIGLGSSLRVAMILAGLILLPVLALCAHSIRRGASSPVQAVEAAQESASNRYVVGAGSDPAP